MSTTLTKEVRNWAMCCHLVSLLQFITIVPIPFVGLIAPLVVWLVKKDEHEFIDRHGKEAINFQIFIVIFTLIIPFILFIFGSFIFAIISFSSIAFLESFVSTFILFFPVYLPISIFLYMLLWTCVGIFALIATLVAANRASNGEVYCYPFTWRFLK